MPSSSTDGYSDTLLRHPIIHYPLHSLFRFFDMRSLHWPPVLFRSPFTHPALRNLPLWGPILGRGANANPMSTISQREPQLS